MKTILVLAVNIIFLKAGAFNITKDTTISGSWDLGGKILNISAVIRGNCIIKNALIEANPFIQIFDTTVALSGCRAREFSAMWYGAAPNNQDNSAALQKSVNACINNMPLYIPSGIYNYSRSLKIYALNNGVYSGASIHIYGDGGYLGWGHHIALYR